MPPNASRRSKWRIRSTLSSTPGSPTPQLAEEDQIIDPTDALDLNIHPPEVIDE